jgi:hypothetical protein
MTDLLFVIAIVSYTLVSKERVEPGQRTAYCKIMTAASVAYDHMDPQGVFSRKSKIHVRFLKVIRQYFI